MPIQPNWSEINELRSSLRAPLLQVNQSEADEVKYVEYNFADRKRFPKTPEQVEITHLTDLQYGAKNFLKDKFKRHMDWLLSSPHRYVALGGDMIDAATILSVGSPFDNEMEPIEQVDGLVELLKPLKQEGRLLGYVGGNHERRTIKTFGDCGRLIARELQVPYSRGVQLIDVRFGKHQPFKLSLWHGGGAARTKGAKAQMLHRFMSQADSHCYMVGHLHDSLVLFDWRQQRVGGKIKLQKVAGVMSSSFLGYWNGYGEVAAMPPNEPLMARVILEEGGGWELTLR